MSKARYSVIVWFDDEERTTHHDAFTDARDMARQRWLVWEGRRRVVVFDERAGAILFRLEPGPIPPKIDPLPCHDPEHSIPHHKRKR